ncbi:MAG: hypothetical protein ABW046_20680 [Actinoplanes sp.]
MELVDVERERHTERQRWRNGGEWDEKAVKIAVGQLAGGRWYVRAYGGHHRQRAYSGPNAEHYARGTARRWMRTIGGTWVDC